MNPSEAILAATRDGDLSQVKAMLESDGSLTHAVDVELKTPLHWAAERDRDEVAAALLDAGADLEAKTSWGATPLDWAATMGSTRVADLLLAAGAEGMNLVTAASLGKLDQIRSLLDEGSSAGSQTRRAVPSEPNDHWIADSACMKRDAISDAFYGACRNGHTAVAALLLKHGADVNAKGVFGGTGLHWAAINGHEDTVAFLLSHGADPAIRDARFDSTPEGWAAEGEHEEIRELLHRA